MQAWLTGAAGAFLVVLACNGAAHAAETIIGSALAVRGAVILDHGASQEPLTAGASIHLGDSIIAGAGKAKIALDDGSVISVGENTRMRIADLDRIPGNAKTRVSLVSGVLRLLVARVPSAGTFEVETETAIAAVRGTEWVIEAAPAQTSVALLSGIVAVAGRGAAPQTTVTLVAPGQGTDVRQGAAPTPVLQWGAQRFHDTVARATFE